MAQLPRTDEDRSTVTAADRPSLSRRSFVRSAAAVATATTVLGAAPTALADEEYDVIEANGQTIDVAGEVFENTIIDVSTGQDITVLVGDDATIRNVGVSGLFRGDGFIFAIDGGGSIEFENVYLGDGATKENSTHAHGPGGVFYHRGAQADVTFRHCNVQGYPNNGFYMSNSAGGGQIVWEECFGKNNGVSTFRGSGGDEIHDCVAYNDDTDYGDGYDLGWVEADGRPVWAWNEGALEIDDSHFAGGTYGGALFTHEGGSIQMHSGAISGETQGAVDVAADVEEDPGLDVPDDVPESAEEAATAD